MKKVLSLLFLLTIILFSANKTNAMSYEEASNDSKPMALLVYASWADDIDKVKQTFDALSQRYDKKDCAQDNSCFAQKLDMFAN